MADLKKKLLDLSKEATGDKDIVVAGDFQPKGMAWKVAVGSAAGAAIGGNSDLTGLGALGGGMAGEYVASSGELPAVVILAASPTKLYLLTTKNAKNVLVAKHYVLIDTLDRANISVVLKQKAMVRTAVITDESTGHEYKLEGKRILFHHMNDMLDALSQDEKSV